MTTSDDAFQQIATVLQGAKISHVWLGDASFFVVECGVLSPSLLRRADGSLGNPMGQWSIELAHDWTVEDARGVLCSSRGDTPPKVEFLDDLVGDVVASVETLGEVAELRVGLRSGRRLLTFDLENEGPQWSLTDRTCSPPIWVYWRDGRLQTDDGRLPG